MKILQNFSMFSGEDQNLLDSQLSWDDMNDNFGPETVRNCRIFQKMAFQKLEKR